MPEHPQSRYLRATGQMPPAGAPGALLPSTAPPQPLQELKRKQIRSISIDLATARTRDNPQAFGVGGNVLAVMRSTFPTDEIEIRLNQEGDWIPMGPGSQLYGFPFEQIEIANAAIPTASMTIVYTTDYPGDRALLRYR